MPMTCEKRYCKHTPAGSTRLCVVDCDSSTHFPLPNFRLLLEELANQTVKAECVNRVVRNPAFEVFCNHQPALSLLARSHSLQRHITFLLVVRQAKLYDQYMNFVCLDARLFSLAQPKTYLQLNDPSATEQQIEATIAEVVNGLFSVIVTLGVVPIIRSPKGGAAQMVASQLDARIRDHLVRRGIDASPFSLAAASPRWSMTVGVNCRRTDALTPLASCIAALAQQPLQRGFYPWLRSHLEARALHFRQEFRAGTFSQERSTSPTSHDCPLCELRCTAVRAFFHLSGPLRLYRE